MDSPLKACMFDPFHPVADNQIALKLYTQQIKKYAAKLEGLIDKNVGKPVIMNQVFYWFSFDVMGHFAFSKSFGMLDTQQWHYSVTMLRAGLELVGPFTPVPWLVRLAFDMPFLRIVRDFQHMEAWCARRMDERIEVRGI